MTKTNMITCFALLALTAQCIAQSQGGGGNNSGYTGVSNAGPFTLTVPSSTSCTKGSSTTFETNTTDYDLYSQYNTETGTTAYMSRSNTVDAISSARPGGVALPSGVAIFVDTILQLDIYASKYRWKITATTGAPTITFDLIWSDYDEETNNALVDSTITSTQSISIVP